MNSAVDDGEKRSSFFSECAVNCPEFVTTRY